MAVFNPIPDQKEHVNTQELLVKLCRDNKIAVVDCPQYFKLTDSERDIYRSDFTEQSLSIRSLPDKLVLTNPPIFIDVKSKVRTDTQNISIELSSFYFSLQRCRIGEPSLFAYISNNELRFFSPLINPPFWINIPRKHSINKAFIKFTQEIQTFFEPNFFMKIPVFNKECNGSNDPFVLVNMKKIHSSLASEVIRRSE